MKKIRYKLIFKLKILFVASILIIVSSTSIFSAQKTYEQKSLISKENIVTNEMIIDFELSELDQSEISNAKGVFTILNIPNSGFIGEIGKPQIPMCTELYAVPTNQVSIEIIETHILETRIVGNIFPAQKPQIDSDYSKDTYFEYDEYFYQQDIYYPDIVVDILDTGNIREIPFVKLGFYPVIYNPKNGFVTIYDKISIKITYNSDDIQIFNSDIKKSFFYPIYENVFTNWQDFYNGLSIENQNLNNIERLNGCDYLIITHPSFYLQAKDLGEWKHKKGIMTKIVNVTDIGSTSSLIRSYIQNAYNTWNPQPSYLLLIGDSEFIPTNYLYSAASDLWYATVDGSDYYADLYYGRIPVDTVNQANIVIQKILTYEQNPPTQASYYSDFSVAAYFQDDEDNGYETRRFVRTSEEVRDYLQSLGYVGERIYVTEPYIDPTNYNNGWYGNGEPLPADLLRPVFPWNGDNVDIINAIEDGIFILNHRDHGFEYGWGDPYFDTSDIASLTNGDLLPVVFSINCLTGRFDGYESFCEEFIRKNNGGAVAIFGATRVSYSGYNDYLCRGFYDAIWPNFDTTVGTNTPMYDLGAILNYGKYYMANTWGNPWGEERYTFELFHVFGDPQLLIWTDVPEDLSVFHPNELSINATSFTVHVEDLIGNDVEDAYVCLWKDDEIYLTDYTDSNGDVTFYPTPLTTGTMYITVTKHNFIPYSVDIQVISGNQQPNIPSSPDPYDGEIDVDINHDLSWVGGDPDPGDTVTYDVYFGTSSPPSQVVTGQSATTYDPGAMSYDETYFWQIVSWDNNGASSTGSIWQFSTELLPNNPPYMPSSPDPYDGEIDVDINHDLSWVGGDPDPGDTVTYDVYFGTSSPPSQVVTGQSATTYDPGAMSYDETYFWQIVSWDNHGASASGLIWSFTTGSDPNSPPYTPSSPDPYDGETDVDINHDLSWVGGDPDPGDTVTYDVYFGTSSPPAQVVWGQSGLSYDPGTLNYDEMYFWQIVSSDNHGASTSGPIWNFATGSAPNNPPNIPSSPDPFDGETDVDINHDLSWVGGDPDPGDTVTYDIYFGDTNPPPLISTGQSEEFFDPGVLEYYTQYFWKVISWDNYGAYTEGSIWSFITMDISIIPDLDCSGSLSWVNVVPGDQVSDTFTVENIGDPASLLNWRIESYPDWGTWTFNPDEGFDLTPEDGELTIEVYVIAPNLQNSEFSGEIKIVNTEDSSDFCIIPVSLATPQNQQLNAYSLLDNLIDNIQIFS